MTVSLNSAIVRIRDAEGSVIGAGFLVGERQVFTCAHVVAQALGILDSTTEVPQGQVLLDFPLVAPEQRLAAQVVIWQPVQASGRGDVAGLELKDALPTGVQPVRLVATDDLWKHPFGAFGFPHGYENGVWASGQILGREATGWLQIEDVKQTGYFVAPGFSGGPAWDEILSGVVGMIVAGDAQPSVRVAFIIPADRLVVAWPELARRSLLSAPVLPSAKIVKNLHAYYLLHGGVRYPIQRETEATLRDVGMKLGLHRANVEDFSSEELMQFPEGDPLPDTTPWIAQSQEDGKCYWIKPRIVLSQEGEKLSWVIVNQKKETVNAQTRVALAGDASPKIVPQEELDRYANLGHIPDYFGIEAELAPPRLIKGKEWEHQYLQLGRIWRHIPYTVKIPARETIGEPVEDKSEKELDQEQIEGVPVQSAEWLIELWKRRGTGRAPRELFFHGTMDDAKRFINRFCKDHYKQFSIAVSEESKTDYGCKLSLAQMRLMTSNERHNHTFGSVELARVSSEVGTIEIIRRNEERTKIVLYSTTEDCRRFSDLLAQEIQDEELAVGSVASHAGDGIAVVDGRLSAESVTALEEQYDLQAVRELLNAAFSDEEITILAFDRFRAVYEEFSSGMSKSEKIRRLVDWCQHNLQMNNLLAEVQQRNPNQYARYARRIVQQ